MVDACVVRVGGRAMQRDGGGEDVGHETSGLAGGDRRGGHDGPWDRTGRCRCGFEVRLFDESSEASDAAKSGIELTLDKGLARGVVTREQKEETLARIACVEHARGGGQGVPDRDRGGA